MGPHRTAGHRGIRGSRRSFGLRAVLVLGLLAALAGCGGGSAPPGTLGDGPIRIGVAVPLTGPNATVGSSVRLGAEVAVAQLNAAGGVLGHQLEVVTADTTSDLTQSVQEVRRLILQEHVDVLVGPTASGQVSALITTINAADVYNVQGSASPAFGPKAAPNSFSITASAGDQGLAQVGFATSKQYRKIAILSDTLEYGRLGSAAIRAAAKQNGIAVTGSAEYQSGTADMTSQVLNLKNTNPQALMVFASNGQDTGRALKALQDLHWDVPVIGNYGTTFTGPATAIAGPDAYRNVTALEYPGFGACSAAQVPAETAQFRTQLKAFDAKAAATAQTDLAANTHDSVLLFAAGADGSKSITGSSVANWLEHHASGLKDGYVNAPFGITPASHFLTSHDALVAVAPGTAVVPGVFKKVAGCR